MKNIKNKIRCNLQYLGIEVISFSKFKFKTFPSPSQFYYQIQNHSLKDQEKALKKYTLQLKTVNNLRYYDNLLRILVPDWKNDYTKAKFVGRGRNKKGLNTYRKLSNKEEKIFEKIYFSNYDITKKIFFFYDSIAPRLENTFKIPKLKKFYKGDLITIVYFEFLTLNKLENKNELIHFFLSIYRYHLKNNFSTFEDTSIKKILYDYTTHSRYERNRLPIKYELKEKGLCLKDIEREIDESSKILTHGDIQTGNAFQKSILIDWDIFGFYPLGLDLSRIYAFLFEHKSIKQFEPEEWVENSLKKHISDSDWKVLKRNFIFFIYVFLYESSRKKPILKNKQIQLVKKYFKK